LPQTSQYLATQVGIIQSERVAKRVIRNLRLTESPVLRERWQEATDGQGDFETWIAESLLNSLEVKPERNANVIGINYVAADPNFASALVNEFIKAYVDVNLELRVSPAKQFSSMFAGELAQARETLEAAQRKLSAFQQEKASSPPTSASTWRPPASTSCLRSWCRCRPSRPMPSAAAPRRA